MIYEVVIVGKSQTQDGQEVLKKTDKNGEVLWIPMDPDNTDYQAYLAQLEETE
jgi:hypothetical protein